MLFGLKPSGQHVYGLLLTFLSQPFWFVCFTGPPADFKKPVFWLLFLVNCLLSLPAKCFVNIWVQCVSCCQSLWHIHIQMKESNMGILLKFSLYSNLWDVMPIITGIWALKKNYMGLFHLLTDVRPAATASMNTPPYMGACSIRWASSLLKVRCLSEVSAALAAISDYKVLLYSMLV